MAKEQKLEDVARLAGVSIATASLALSERGRISADTRERVLNAALELGYRRKPKKQPIAEAREQDIAVLFDIDPEWSMVLFLVRPIIQEMSRTFRQAGFNTVLLPISRSEPMAEILDQIRSSGAVGVVTIHFVSAELLLLLESAGMPVVVVMNSSYQDRFYTVCVDDFQGAYEGTRFLIHAGHQRIGYVDCVRPDLPVLPIDRFFGFSKAIEEYHLTFDSTMRRRLGLRDEHEDREALAGLLREHPDITAIFALDDDLGVRVATLLGKIGCQVPRDLSMIAPGDMLDYSLCYVPPLTTMRIDTTYMGRLAAQMIVNRVVHNPQEVQVLKVKQQLIRRGTVRSLRE